MSTHYAIVERVKSGCGRKVNQDWLNILISPQISPGEWSALLTHPNYSNPSFPRFVVQLTAAEHAALQSNGLLTDEFSNLPRWQQRVAGTGEPTELGHYSDPRSTGSTWVPGVPIPDDRQIVRIYDGNPNAGGLAIGSRPNDPPGGEDLDESQVPGFVTRYIRLFSPADAPLNNNTENAKTFIAGKRMIFDFGSTHVPPLPGGVSSFEVSTQRAGRVEFGSSHEFRVVGPLGEKEITFSTYGRRLEVQS